MKIFGTMLVAPPTEELNQLHVTISRLHNRAWRTVDMAARSKMASRVVNIDGSDTAENGDDAQLGNWFSFRSTAEENPDIFADIRGGRDSSIPQDEDAALCPNLTSDIAQAAASLVFSHY
jgi:hypothetical protein